MKLLDLTLPTPAENLALDEALLDAAEAGAGGEVLRFWEPKEYFVVVGYANKVDVEVNRSTCERLNVPIYRRCSGGGTVVQGPGCLNYTLILNNHRSPEVATVPQTNTFVMERQKQAISCALPETSAPVSVRGHTDLTLGPLKFSGNAQRRKRDFLIFHGTFLLNFDLSLVEQVLRMPSKQPDYRQDRTHLQFLTNLSIPATSVKAALTRIWQADDALRAVPECNTLVQEKYSKAAWNLKF